MKEGYQTQILQHQTIEVSGCEHVILEEKGRMTPRKSIDLKGCPRDRAFSYWFQRIRPLFLVGNMPPLSS